MKKGAMKTTPETVMSVLACSPAAPPAPPKPNRISMTREFFTKLSLRAEQSWHQNSGANLRVVIKLLNMRASVGETCAGDPALDYATPQLSRNRGSNMNGVQIFRRALAAAARAVLPFCAGS